MAFKVSSIAFSFIFPLLSQGPPEIPKEFTATTGQYRNQSYGFTVTIPKQLAGKWNGPTPWYDEEEKMWMSFSDHGRTINPEPNVVIEISAFFKLRNVELSNCVYTELKSFQDNVDDLDFTIDFIKPTSLSGNHAISYRATRMINGVTTIREGVISYSYKSKVENQFYIQAPESKFKLYKRHYDKIIKSLKWRPIS